MTAPVRTGRRTPALLMPVKTPDVEAEAEPVYVVGTKPIRHQGEILQPGTPVPGAASWPRLESRLRARTLALQPK